METRNRPTVTKGEGEEDNGERKGRGKPRSTNRGFMGMENGGVGLWEWVEWDRGEQWGKRRDNCG